MQHIRSTNTSIEIKLRKKLWEEGIRYRKYYKLLPGKPDIVITKWKIVVFCDSSFWHGRNFSSKKPIKTNKEYWDKKIRRNIERDIEVNSQLKTMGWYILRFWDDEINKHIDDCVNKVKAKIDQIKIDYYHNKND